MSLIFNYMSMHFRVKMQYKISFLLTFITQLLVVGVELFVLRNIFSKFSLLDRYNIYELYFNFCIIWFGHSAAQTIGRGFDKFSNLVVDGSFDLLLIRPRNIYIQIIGSDMFYEKISRVISTFILLIYSFFKITVNISLFKVFVLLLIIIGSIMMVLSVFIIGAAVSFYTIQGIEFINIFTDGTKQLGQYPMGIFNGIVRGIFTFIIPLTLINYYPMKYLTGETCNYMYGLLPIFAILFIIPAVLIFNTGLKKYKSSGS